MRSRMARTVLALGLLAACSGGSDGGDSGDGDSGGDAAGSDGGPGGADAAPLGEYESFVSSIAGGPCPADTDCTGSSELTACGVLLVDRLGELPVVIHQAEVTEEEQAAAVAIFTDPALLALLDGSEPPCEGPTDVVEQMTLYAGGLQHSNAVTGCTDPPIEAARTALADLATTYFPE